MRWQRNEFKGSRPEGLGHPNPTRHTAESYREKCRRPTLAYLFRLIRMQKREAKVEAK